HAAGDLAHRRQQRQRTADLQRLVGEALRLALQHRVGELAVGGEVEVREQQLPLLDQRVLLRQRLLDLDDHLRLAVDAGGAGLHARADLGERGVGDAGAEPRALRTCTSWPCATRSSTIAGTAPTRFSWALISLGTPMIMGSVAREPGAWGNGAWSI